MEYLKRLIKMVCYLPLTIKEWHKKRNFYKKFSKRGIHYNIMPSAKINFNDGSSACDIELGDYVTIYGYEPIRGC